MIEGISWTANQAQKRGRPSVANMSVGGSKSAIANSAIAGTNPPLCYRSFSLVLTKPLDAVVCGTCAAAVDAGVTFVVSAGNENSDACRRSPASEPLAITVAATTIVSSSSGASQDRRTSFSNFGKCVDIAAPGELIKAAWIDQDGFAPNTLFNTISGTSMASPHVAGVAAIVLSKYPKYTPAEVETALYKVATEGVIDLACSGLWESVRVECLGTPNKLLYTNC
jgi:serine protease